LQEHEAMEEDMEGEQPQRRRPKKKRVVDPETYECKLMFMYCSFIICSGVSK